jgi:hypothetical protein
MESSSRQHTSTTPGSRARQPRGVPVGGQFARSENPEATVDLIEGAEETRRIAGSYVRRFGLGNKQLNGYMDGDDLVQDAVLAYLVAANAAVADTTRPPDASPIPTSLIAKRSIIRALEGKDHKRFAAMRLFDQEKASREARLARAMSAKELEDLSSEIRLSIPAHSRPSENFHIPAPVTHGLDWSVTRAKEGGSRPVDHVEVASFQVANSAAEIDTSDFEDGSFGDRASQLKSDGHQVKARALAWDAIAENSGAPLTLDVPIGKRAAIRARADVVEAGGALACAEQYMASGETTSSLFAPFGDLDDAQRRATCETLIRFPDYAADLWKVAISRVEGRAV